MITIGKRKALSLLAQAVKEYGPDHRVQTCSYLLAEENGELVEPLAPNCIIGVAVWNLLDGEAEVAKRLFVDCNSELIEVLWDHLGEAGIHVTAAARVIFRRAQEVQDGRVEVLDPEWGLNPQPWANALKAARECL